MTEIFYLMWLADLAGSVSVVCLLSLLAAVGCFLFYVLSTCAGDRPPKSVTRWAIGLVLVGLIGVFTPSKQTIQLLAVAKAGSVAIETETGAKALKAVNVILDGVISKKEK